MFTLLGVRAFTLEWLKEQGMLLLCTTSATAYELGAVLDIPRDRVHAVETAFGYAQVFFVEVSETRTTIALLLDENSTVPLQKSPREWSDPYFGDPLRGGLAAISLALAAVCKSILSPGSSSQTDGVTKHFDWLVHIPAMHCHGGFASLSRLFAPLAYRVTTKKLSHETAVLGERSLMQLEIQGTQRIEDLVAHLCMLLPVIDGSFVPAVQEVLRDVFSHCNLSWLQQHPERDNVLQQIVCQLGVDPTGHAADAKSKLPTRTDASRHEGEVSHMSVEVALAICDQLLDQKVHSVVDILCGQGHLLTHLVAATPIETMIGVDCCADHLQQAHQRLRLETVAGEENSRIKLLQGSPLYRDGRLAGVDGVVLCDMNQRLPKNRLDMVADVVLGHIAPYVFIMVLPNRDYAACKGSEDKGLQRRQASRTAWNRDQFERWCGDIANTYAVHVAMYPVGEWHDQSGSPAQMAVFLR